MGSARPEDKKIKIHKSIAYLYSNDERLKIEIKNNTIYTHSEENYILRCKCDERVSDQNADKYKMWVEETKTYMTGESHARFVDQKAQPGAEVSPPKSICWLLAAPGKASRKVLVDTDELSKIHTEKHRS